MCDTIMHYEEFKISRKLFLNACDSQIYAIVILQHCNVIYDSEQKWTLS